MDRKNMTRSQIAPLVGTVTAIVVTATMDATGLSAASALPLCPLLALFWYLQRLSRLEVGFQWGRLRHYGLAVVHPLGALGILALAAALMGATQIASGEWRKPLINIATVSTATTLTAVVTEEGFFRGWLWGSLRRSGMVPWTVLLWTSSAFALWHLSAVLLPTGFDPPLSQVPVFMINAFLLGTIWGMLRWISGSVVVASVGHGVWNGLAYVLFGFGSKLGYLGIRETALYGPEVGYLGIAMNLIFAAFLFRRVVRDGWLPSPHPSSS